MTPTALAFRLPDFTRLSWASDLAEGVWKPRFEAAALMVRHVEVLSVQEGRRAAALLRCTARELPAMVQRLARTGLMAAPVEITGTPTGVYTNGTAPYDPRQPPSFAVVVGRHTALVSDFAEAWSARDDVHIGQMLGYPKCCTEFFARTWGSGALDTTWQMTVRTTKDPEVRVQEVRPMMGTNVLWRYVGLRAVFHLPCSFSCVESSELALVHGELANGHGYAADWRTLSDVLSWPVEWSALHGIAEIKTPILRISTRTDATAEKLSLRVVGTSLPDEASHGLGHAYAPPVKAPRRPVVLPTPVMRPHADPEHVVRRNESARANGFVTIEAMARSHAPIVQAAHQVVGGRRGMVLDLGCGDGTLVKTICEIGDDLHPAGVDQRGDVVRLALVDAPPSSRFTQGDLFDVDFSSYGRLVLTLLMLGRLSERPREVGRDFLARLLASGADLLAYTHDGTGDEFARLCERHGLEGSRLGDRLIHVAAHGQPIDENGRP